MNKKKIKIATAIVVALGLGFIFYNQTIPDEYVPDDNEIALHIQFDINEDIGLLVYDYRANGHEYSGGISNADVGQPPEQSGLSAAVPAQNAHQLPAGHREGDVPDHEIGISGPQAPHLKHRPHRPPPSSATARCV